MAKYSASLVKEFVAELEKVPMIRQACSKIGIDHSTVYRWMLRHPDFYSKVQMALGIGRKNVTDAAESVILNGIQNKEFRSASFWLQHNEYRYMRPKHGMYHGVLAQNTAQHIKESYDDKTRPRFDLLFDYYYKIERDYPDEPEPIKHWITPLVEVFCDHDQRLMDIFYAAYEEWKKDRVMFERSASRAGYEFDEDGNIMEKESR